MGNMYKKILFGAGILAVSAFLHLFYSFYLVLTGEEVAGRHFVLDEKSPINLDGLNVSEETRAILIPQNHLPENIEICEVFPRNIALTIAKALCNQDSHFGYCKFPYGCRNPRFIEFRTKDNIQIREFTFDYVWGLKDRNVRIFYNHANPNKYRIFDLAGIFSTPAILLLFSVAALLIGILTKLTESGQIFHQGIKENPNLYLIALAVKISLIDGVLERREIREIDTLIRKFSVVEDKLEAYRIIKFAKSEDMGIEELAVSFKNTVRERGPELRLAFEFLVSVVSGYEEIDVLEKKALQTIGSIFKMPTELLEELLSVKRNFNEFYSNDSFDESSKFGNRDSISDSKRWAYQELECEYGADEEKIKKNYRALVMKYHPDKLQQRGIDDLLLKQGKEKFFRIQKAYELLVV